MLQPESLLQLAGWLVTCGKNVISGAAGVL